MKRMIRCMCLVFALVMVAGLVIPAQAATNSYYKQFGIEGAYSIEGPWSQWSEWTFDKILSEKTDRTYFTGSLFQVETEVETATVWVRKGTGEVDNVWCPWVAWGWFGYKGYTERTKYRFRVRYLGWKNKKILTGKPYFNIRTPKDAETANLAIQIGTKQCLDNIKWCVKQCKEYLKGEVVSAAIGCIPGRVGTIISRTYGIYDLVDRVRLIKEMEANAKKCIW